MIDRAPEHTLRHPLGRQHQRFNRALLIRYALRGAAWCALAIAAAILVGLLFATGTAGAWTRLLALTAAAVVAIVASTRDFLRQRLDLDAYLERVEAHLPQLRSWIRNAVDFEATSHPHVSADLATALRSEAARRLEGAPLGALAPRIEAGRPTLTMAIGLVLMVGSALLWPSATARSWNTLWNPSAAAPPVRLVVEPGSVTITPGASLAVRARVWGTDRPPRIDRDRSGPGPDAVTPVAEGRDERGGRTWRFDLVQLTRAQDYSVRVASVRSPRYHIGLSGSLAPVSFEVEYRAPAYARLPIQRGTAARGDLTALQGTVASLVVTFDRDLERLDSRLSDGRTSAWTALTPRRWRGQVPVTRDGEYELVAAARRGTDGGPGQGRFRYRVTALPDAPPVLVVQVPRGDLDLPAGQQVPVDVLAQDDLGLTELTLQSRKDPAAPWRDLQLARFSAGPREARVESRWDAAPLGLLPGESATFRFVLFDDNAVSGRGSAVSPTFELRFPSLADLYENVDDRQSGAQQKLEKVAEETRELQKSLDKLTRQQPRQDQAPSTSFERSEELRSTLERQQEVSRKIEEATEDLHQSLDQAAERNMFDQDLMQKLKQMTDLMQQIQSPEFKEAVRKMQQALEKMDRQAMERNVPQLRAENQELIKNLERTLELLKKLREEERVQALAQKAKELKAQQDALNQEHENLSHLDRPQAADLAQRQEKAGEQSKELAKEAQEVAKQADAQEQKSQLSEAAKSLDQEAASAQQQAAESARQQQQQAAQQSGHQASAALDKAASSLQQAAAAMQNEQQQVDVAAVRRAAQDLVSLQQSSQSSLGSNLGSPEKAERQTDLSEGASRVADSLYQLSRETPFISPRLGETLGRAINGLQSSGREFSGGDRARGEEAGRQALESLNQAVLELRATESSMCNKPGGRPGGRIPTTQQQVGEMGQRQSELNRQTRSLAQRLSEQMRLSAGDRDQMRQMAEEQARIREQLEQIQRDEEARHELLGRLDQAHSDMKDVEEVLKQGAMDDQLQEKQQRILSRLLDAQRSVNRRDFDPQRESRPGEDLARRGPAELSPDLLRESDRFRQDLLKSELDRYPAQYRAFVEAYLRSLNGSRR
jgi:hypothetical protein